MAQENEDKRRNTYNNTVPNCGVYWGDGAACVQGRRAMWCRCVSDSWRGWLFFRKWYGWSTDAVVPRLPDPSRSLSKGELAFLRVRHGTASHGFSVFVCGQRSFFNKHYLEVRHCVVHVSSFVLVFLCKSYLQASNTNSPTSVFLVITFSQIFPETYVRISPSTFSSFVAVQCYWHILQSNFEYLTSPCNTRFAFAVQFTVEDSTLTSILWYKLKGHWSDL